MKCGLLLQMLHVAWSVCLSVLATKVTCEKEDKPIEMLFGVTGLRGCKELSIR